MSLTTSARVAAAALLVGCWAASAGVAFAEPGPPPGPAPGPPVIEGDGTYAVGSEIAPGMYSSAGPVEGSACYWKRVDADGAIIDSAMTKKPSMVQIAPTDASFTTSDCQTWQPDACLPGCAPGERSAQSILGDLATFVLPRLGSAPPAP